MPVNTAWQALANYVYSASMTKGKIFLRDPLSCFIAKHRISLISTIGRVVGITVLFQRVCLTEGAAGSLVQESEAWDGATLVTRTSMAQASGRFWIGRGLVRLETNSGPLASSLGWLAQVMQQRAVSREASAGAQIPGATDLAEAGYCHKGSSNRFEFI